MEPREGRGQDRSEPRPDRPESQEQTVAPPIEREHETLQGILEEDEKRKREQEQERK